MRQVQQRQRHLNMVVVFPPQLSPHQLVLPNPHFMTNIELKW